MSAEQPLLLNPCEDEPQSHLCCAEDDAAVFRPRSDRGEASIDVYGLNRASIVVARREVLFHIHFHLHTVRTLVKARVHANDRVAVFLEDLYRRELGILARMRRSNRPFSMMARQVIDPYMETVLGCGADNP